MELVKIATGEPITRSQLEAEVSVDGLELSLPYDLTGVDLSDFGAAVVVPTEPPSADPGEVAERDGVEKIGGVWRQKWLVRPMNQQELDALVPQVVSRRQALRALDAAGLLDNVEAQIALLPRAAQIEWANATEFRRDHPLIGQLGAALGLLDNDVDALFVTAAVL